ncbi:2'-5' RNA ligase family protein [Microbacterium sp. RU33B]|uniref:2'-5' RNA ligase family protein n=1 Tax=Microbacterium sp. RU33B TaxID=1907390 RepID=UPI000969A6E0|nr:2'-5' RNA ligase family protein [Microbacterium sp. RU33B]SIT87896.1 2'-5' RNA ligase [Microbacterium sp. RU33B]
MTETRARPALTSIELLLDAETEALVRADWDRLAAAGMSSLAAHRAESNRPHITLLARPFLAPQSFAAVVAQLPVPVTLGEPMLFPHGDRGVLARRVVPDAGIRRLHAAIHAAAPPGDDAPYTAPGDWTPHVTLARRLRVDQFDDALRLLGPVRVGTAVALRRWDAAAAEVTALA